MFGGLFSRKRAGLETVILPEYASAPETEDWEVTNAVVDFVNKMRSEALFFDLEMPENAIQLYNADFYVAQVSNGGHSQFIHNSLNPEAALKLAAKAFLEMEMISLGRLAVKLAKWIKANPEEAAKQNGFEIRASALEGLDKDFFSVVEGNTYFKAASVWVKSWPNLNIVSGLEYPNAIKGCAALNHKYELRKEAAEIDRLNSLVRDRLRAGFQLAACDEDINQVVLQVHGGTPFEIEGEDTYLWGLTTSLGHRRGVVYSGGARIANVKDGQLHEQVGGRGLHYLETAVAHATRHEIGAAIRMLTKKAKIGGDVQFVICATLPEASDSRKDDANYLVKIGEELFPITVSNSAASITRLNTKKALAKLSMREIKKSVSHLKTQLAQPK